MNKTIYSQLDSRWSDKPYPTSNSSFGGNGCGPCAVTHVAIEQKSKANWTPNKLRKWMIEKGYAVPGHGTEWSGIKAALKYIGHERVVWIGRNDPMSDAWNELNRGNRMGVLLVDNSKTPDGTVWTASGHYVAFIKYKREEDGRHYFYIKDSGFRKHNGWYCYEKSLKGALPQMWIVEKLSTVASWVKDANSWAKTIAADDSWHYVTWSSNSETHECPICHNHPKGKFHGWNCIGFSFAYWHHGGKLPCNCSCGVIDDSFMTKLLTMDNDKALKQLQEKIGLKDLQLIRNNKKIIPQSKMKAGDLCLVYDKNNKCIHIYPYIGSGYMIDCGGWSDISKQIAKRTASSCKVIIRYVGASSAEKTVQQKIVAYAKKIANDDSYIYVHWKKDDPKTKQCPICHNFPKGKYHGFYCTRFPISMWHHGGGIKIKCDKAPNNGQIDKIYNAKTDAQALKLAQQYFGIKDIKVIRNKKGIPQDKLKAGDSCYYFNGNTCQHAFLYIGNGKMIDANSLKDGIAVRKAMSCKVAIRYTGK